MKISDNDIDKIAALARIRLVSKKREGYKTELSDILTYVEQLSEVNTDNVESFDQASSVNKLRPDAAANENTPAKRDALLKAAPEVEAGYIIVPKVFGDE